MARPRKSPRGASAVRDVAAPVSSEQPAGEGGGGGGAFANFCRNPFCGAGLANSVTRYCEDKPNCQRYRAVMMHCAFRRVLARAGAPLATDEAPSNAHGRDGGDATFSIPRRKRKAEDGSDSEQQEKSGNAAGKKKKRKTKQPAVDATATKSSSSMAGQDALPTEMRMRQRHILRHVEASASTEAPQSEAEPTHMPMEDTGRPAGGRTTTAAQAVKQMDIELVPLGASNQAVNFAGGGRYVQSGNRATGPALLPPPPPPLSPPPLPARPVPPSTFRPPLPPKPPSNAVGAVPGHTSAAARAVPPRISTAVPPVHRSFVTSTLNDTVGAELVPSGARLPSSTAAGSSIADKGSSQAGTRRISASDYLSSRKGQETTASSRTSTGASSSQQNDTDYSFSDWDQSTTHEAVPSGARSSLSAARSDSYRKAQEHQPLASGQSLSDDRNRVPISLNNRPDYRRSNSDTAAQSSSSHRGDRYVPSSMPDAYREFRNYPDDRHREPPSYRSVDERARVDEYARRNRDGDRRSPRRERYEDGFQHDRSLPRESFGGPRRIVDAFGREIRSEERDRSTDRASVRASAPSPSNSEAHDRRHSQTNASASIGSGATSSSSSPYDIEPPPFSYHDTFVRDLLSVFIRDIPYAIGAVKNETKKPRKMKWFLDYVDRVVKLFGPDVKIEIKNNKAVMLVKHREWLVMEDPSTTSLYRRVLHRLLGEALMWRHMRDEAEKRFKEAFKMYGSATNSGIVFIQTWNELKTHTSREYIPLEKQVRYFCGERKHHWTFSVGNVEIGSGSHEDKRTAFNFATAASMKFLMQLRRERWTSENSASSRSQDRASTEGQENREDRAYRRSDRPMDDRHTRSEPVANDASGRDNRAATADSHRRSEPVADDASGRDSRAATVAGDTPETRGSEPVAVGASGRNNGAAMVVGEAQNASGVPDQRADEKEAQSQTQPTNSTNGDNTQVEATVEKALPTQSEATTAINGNGAEAAAGATADPENAPRKPVDPRLRRPSTDLRVRRPPLADPRANGPGSAQRTRGPATDPRAGPSSDFKTHGSTSDPRTQAASGVPVLAAATAAPNKGSDAGGGGSDKAGTSSRMAEPSDDDMSISEESDRGTTPQASIVPPAHPTADTQDTMCRFCAMIRMSKPDAVDAKCFRCQAKAASDTS